MTLLIGLACLFGLQTPSVVRHQEPLSNKASLSLITDKSSYLAGEPVRITVTVRNDSDEPILANFSLYPAFGLEVWYGKAGATLHLLTCRFSPAKVRWAVKRTPLLPGQERSTDLVVLLDAATDTFAFAQPGRFEVKAVYKDVKDNPYAVLESPLVSIDVLPPPSSEEEAFARFSSLELMKLAQYGGSYYVGFVTTEVLQQAEAFLDQFAGSVYADHLKRGLLAYLQHVRAGGGLDLAYVMYCDRLYKRIAREPPPAPMPAVSIPPDR